MFALERISDDQLGGAAADAAAADADAKDVQQLQALFQAVEPMFQTFLVHIATNAELYAQLKVCYQTDKPKNPKVKTASLSKDDIRSYLEEFHEFLYRKEMEQDDANTYMRRPFIKAFYAYMRRQRKIPSTRISAKTIENTLQDVFGARRAFPVSFEFERQLLNLVRANPKISLVKLRDLWKQIRNNEEADWPPARLVFIERALSNLKDEKEITYTTRKDGVRLYSFDDPSWSDVKKGGADKCPGIKQQRQELFSNMKQLYESAEPLAREFFRILTGVSIGPYPAWNKYDSALVQFACDFYIMTNVIDSLTSKSPMPLSVFGPEFMEKLVENATSSLSTVLNNREFTSAQTKELGRMIRSRFVQVVKRVPRTITKGTRFFLREAQPKPKPKANGRKVGSRQSLQERPAAEINAISVYQTMEEAGQTKLWTAQSLSKVAKIPQSQQSLVQVALDELFARDLVAKTRRKGKVFYTANPIRVDASNARKLKEQQKQQKERKKRNARELKEQQKQKREEQKRNGTLNAINDRRRAIKQNRKIVAEQRQKIMAEDQQALKEYISSEYDTFTDDEKRELFEKENSAKRKEFVNLIRARAKREKLKVSQKQITDLVNTVINVDPDATDTEEDDENEVGIANDGLKKPAISPAWTYQDSASPWRTDDYLQKLPSIRYMAKGVGALEGTPILDKKEAISLLDTNAIANDDEKRSFAQQFKTFISKTPDAKLVRLASRGGNANQEPEGLMALRDAENTVYSQDMDNALRSLFGSNANNILENTSELCYIARFSSASSKGAMLAYALEYVHEKEKKNFAFALLDKTIPPFLASGRRAEAESWRQRMQLPKGDPNKTEAIPYVPARGRPQADPNDYLLLGPLARSYVESGWNVCVCVYTKVPATRKGKKTNSQYKWKNLKIYHPEEAEAFIADVTTKGRSFDTLAYRDLMDRKSNTVPQALTRRISSVVSALTAPMETQAVIDLSQARQVLDKADASLQQKATALRAILTMVEGAKMDPKQKLNLQQKLTFFLSQILDNLRG
jgi:hypothetical protein